MQTNNQELVTITVKNIGVDNIQTVNARDLYKTLEIGKDFSNWIKDQIDRARLIEERDYIISVNQSAQKGGLPSGGKPRTEYHLSIDSAKHIAMMSGTDKGFEVRNYFLECERIAHRETAKYNNMTRIESLRAYADALEREEAALKVIDSNRLYPRVLPTPDGDSISIKKIKEEFAPYIAPDKIMLILRWYGQDRTNFLTLTTFCRDGLKELFDKFLSDATYKVSSSKDSVIVTHDCLDQATIRVPKASAMQYLGYTKVDFK